MTPPQIPDHILKMIEEEARKKYNTDYKIKSDSDAIAFNRAISFESGGWFMYPLAYAQGLRDAFRTLRNQGYKHEAAMLALHFSIELKALGDVGKEEK